MTERNPGSESGKDSGRENHSSQTAKNTGHGKTRMTGMLNPENSRRTKEVRQDVEKRSADVIGEISGPEVINALHVAGDTIKSAGDLAGAVNNIGVTVAGATIVAKKTLGKLKGTNDKGPDNKSGRTKT